jgi:hypothetical protein
VYPYYECPPQTGLAVPPGTSITFPIPYPTRVRLTNLRVRQTHGDLAPFSIDLYNRAVPDTPGSVSSDDEFYLVNPVTSVDSTSLGFLIADFSGVDVYFTNQDEPEHVYAQGEPTPSLVSILGGRVIYARITNDGGTENTYEFMLGSVATV